MYFVRQFLWKEHRFHFVEYCAVVENGNHFHDELVVVASLIRMPLSSSSAVNALANPGSSGYRHKIGHTRGVHTDADVPASSTRIRVIRVILAIVAVGPTQIP